MWERQGTYEIAVFTAPNRIVAGPIDISVLLLDSTNGEPITDATINVELKRSGRPDETLLHLATRGAATNKLLHAALFEIPEPGAWLVDVAVSGATEHANVRFNLEAGEPNPKWFTLWPWVCWPLPVIVLYAIHQRLVWWKTRSHLGSSVRTETASGSP